MKFLLNLFNACPLEVYKQHPLVGCDDLVFAVDYHFGCSVKKHLANIPTNDLQVCQFNSFLKSLTVTSVAKINALMLVNRSI